MAALLVALWLVLSAAAFARSVGSSLKEEYHFDRMMCVLLWTLRFEVRCLGYCNSYILTLELRQICCIEMQLLSIYNSLSAVGQS